MSVLCAACRTALLVSPSKGVDEVVHHRDDNDFLLPHALRKMYCTRKMISAFDCVPAAFTCSFFLPQHGSGNPQRVPLLLTDGNGACDWCPLFSTGVAFGNRRDEISTPYSRRNTEKFAGMPKREEPVEIMMQRTEYSRINSYIVSSWCKCIGVAYPLLPTHSPPFPRFRFAVCFSVLPSVRGSCASTDGYIETNPHPLTNHNQHQLRSRRPSRGRVTIAVNATTTIY